MRRGLICAPILALALSGLAFLATPVTGQDTLPTKKSTAPTTGKENAALRKQIDELTEKIEASETARKEQADKLDATEKQLKGLTGSIQTKVEAALKAAQAKADMAKEKSESELAALERKFNKDMDQARAEAAKGLADLKKASGEKPPEVEPKGLTDLTSVVNNADTGLANTRTEALRRGDIAWLLTATALVMVMMPGLALFYGGMARRKNVLATLMQSMAPLAVVGLVWVAFGYGLAFGPSQIKLNILGVTDGGLIGWDSKFFFLKGVAADDVLPGYNIPVYLHVMFQGMFAIITGALISGAWAERIRFWPYCIFLTIWTTVVYCPLAHMVWSFDFFTDVPLDYVKGLGASATGLLGKMGALDFAGGTVVHIAAGIAGLAGTFVLRKRLGYPDHAMHPNSMVLTLIGAGLLWFGWFGFNGGSSLNSSSLSVSAFAATQAAAAAAGIAWMLIEWLHKGKPTALGLASGIVAGLVAVTPASGYVYAWGGAVIGILASLVCYIAVNLKTVFGYDDSLDAFGVHCIGGFLGAVLTGFFCYAEVNSAGADGYLAYQSRQPRIEQIKAELPAAEKAVVDTTAASEGNKKQLDARLADLASKLVSAKDDEKTRLTNDETGTKAELAELIYPVSKATATRDALVKELATLEKLVADRQAAGKSSLSQPGIQLIAAATALVYSFFASLVLVALVQVMTLGNFRTSEKDEVEGLDRTEHGEVGFDFGLTGDTVPSSPSTSPRSAKEPPGTKRFAVVVEGVENGGLLQAWSDLCKPSEGPVDADFKAIYPYVTTVNGNRFRFRGGDSAKLSTHVLKLFQKKIGKPLKVRVEE